MIPVAKVSSLVEETVMNVETGLAIAIFILYWFLTVFTYVLEKIEYASHVSPAPETPKTVIQWVLDKLHLPRDKYVKNDPNDAAGS
jgi:hypothetical protein